MGPQGWSVDLGGRPIPFSGLWALLFGAATLGTFLARYVCLWVHLEAGFALQVAHLIHVLSSFTIERKHNFDPRVDVGLGVCHLDYGSLGE
jgi:hypothetical protein